MCPTCFDKHKKGVREENERRHRESGNQQPLSCPFCRAAITAWRVIELVPEDIQALIEEREQSSIHQEETKELNDSFQLILTAFNRLRHTAYADDLMDHIPSTTRSRLFAARAARGLLETFNNEWLQAINEWEGQDCL
jgi:hypothetical protein